MPVSKNFSTVGNEDYQIPEKVYSMRVRMWGGGGGGEFVPQSTIGSTDGGSGGNTTWLGMTAAGGQGGGVSGGKNSLGGGGGTNTGAFTGFTALSGNNGALSTGGAGRNLGGSVFGAAGNGTPGFATYTSSSIHVFNNDTNEHILQNFSSDIVINYENKNAPDGIYGTTPSNGKYYSVRFVIPFINNSWTLEVTGICQQAAGGATASPYSLNGSANKYNGGVNIWFQNNAGANGYIRCFTVIATGIKGGAQGIGGGSGGAIEVTLSRSQLINAGYSPGATYTATVGGGGGAGGNTATSGSQGYIQLFMYIIPTVTVNVTKTVIISGECVDVSWNTTGDASTLTWTSGGISNTLLTSSSTVCPSVTTTYTAVASGLGGSSPPASVTVTVYQPPTAEFSAPDSLLYGQQGFLSYDTQYANVSITITPLYTYRNNETGEFFVSTGNVVNITPVASSAEYGGPNTVISNNALPTDIPYNEQGPFSVQYVLVATGSGGQVTKTYTTTIVIDQNPDNLIVEETDGRFKSEDPVFTPQTEIVTEMMLVDGVDIPIEVKSNYPIQVDINGEQVWKNVRQI
jgi:hypothetical protein